MARLTTIYPGSATNTTAINPTQVATSVNGQTGDVTLEAGDIVGLSEYIDDRVDALLVAGANLSKTYDDGANSLTLDVLGTASSAHTHTSTDITDFTEAAQDAAALLFTTATHSGISATYSDANGTVTLANTSPGGTTIVNQTSEDFKDSVACATTANITLSGEQTIDGVLTSASRVLVKNQTTGSQNGIYVSAAGAWSRATDADEDAEVTTGLMVYVESGTVNGQKVFQLTTTGTITVGTTPLAFSQVQTAASYEIVKNQVSTSYTLTTSDPNCWIRSSNGSTQTITIPANTTAAIAVNSVIWVQKYGAGNVTFAAAGGVTLRAPGGSTISTQYAVARLKKLATNEWVVHIIGQGTSSLPTSGSPSLVQRKKQTGGRATDPMAFSLDSSPTVGNLLLLVVAGYSSSPMLVPSGWQPVVLDALATPNQMVQVFSRIAQSGDGTSWSFGLQGGPKGGVMFEISSWKSIDYRQANGNNGTEQSMPAVPKDLASALILWVATCDNSQTAAPTLNTGNTLLESFVNDGTNHCSFFGRYDGVLAYSDSVLAATCVATWNSAANTPLAYAIIIRGALS